MDSLITAEQLALGEGAPYRAPLVRSFREVLARRGADPELTIHSLDCCGALVCEECLAAAAGKLGYELERLVPSEGEAGVVESYTTSSFWHDRTRREAPVRWHDENRFGLSVFRHPDQPSLWWWEHEQQTEYAPDAVLLVAGASGALRALIEALVPLHARHERRGKALFLVGTCREQRAARSPISWDEVILPAALRDELRTSVEEFFGNADLYRKHEIAHRRGILLAGPPGNGKTSILRAISGSLDVPVVVARLDQSPDQRSNCDRAFERAAELSPAVLCFEDLDALLGDGPELSRFLNQLDGLEGLDGVLVVATTNRPDRIDDAIAKRPSRFDRVFLISEPEEPERIAFLTRALGQDAPPGSAQRLAAETGGYSMAFLKELILQARLTAVRRGAEELSDEDLDRALETTREHLRLAARGLEARGVGFK
jgi:AAA+ superfamily predicted ATPase